MAHIVCTVTTTLSKRAFIGALTDFSKHRLELWPNIAPNYYKVHHITNTSADVTEGSNFAGGIYERSIYDWSQPDTVLLTVTDSNTFAPGSFWKYTLHEEDGHTVINLEVVRKIRTFKSVLLSIPLAIFGKKIFQQDLQKTVTFLETHER